MAEEYNRDELAQEIEAQAAQLAEAAAEHAAPEVRDALEADALEDAAPEAPTELIELPEDAAPVAESTAILEPPTAAIPVQVEKTSEMPNPFPAVGATTPIPEPVVTTEGYDVSAVDVIPDTPAVGEVRDPFAPATVAAAAGMAGAGVAAGAAQVPPAQPVQPTQPASPYQQPAAPDAQPWRQQAAYAQSYANPDYRQAVPNPGAYQGAVQHQPFMADPTVNPYEQSMTQLSGGMKFGWLVVGLMLGIPGMVIAWLVNEGKHPQVKHDAIMFSVIGFVITLVLDIIAIVAFTGMVAAAVATYGGYSGLYF